MKRSVWTIAATLAATAALAVVGHGFLEAPIAWAQINAIARWDMNDDPWDPSTEGVADVAGLPNPNFPGDAHGDVTRCSEEEIETPRGPAGPTYGDCLVFADTGHVSGDAGEHLLEPNSSSISRSSRTLMAWVRVGTEDGVDHDMQLIDIGRAAGNNEDQNCGNYDGDAGCSVFSLILEEGGKPSVGNGWGETGAMITCTNKDLDTSETFDEWHFIVGVFDLDDAESESTTPKSTRLYVNGDECASGDIFIPHTKLDSNSSWAIGASLSSAGTGTGNHYTGAIDDARVFDRAMDEAEIDALWVATGNGGG